MTKLYTILFVDQEPYMKNALKRSFRHMRSVWELRFAASPDEAIEALSRRPADVMVCAMQFSGASGLALLKKIRDQFPQTVRIILSGTVSRDVLLSSVDIAHQYLTKPIELEELEGVIKSAFFVKKLMDDPFLQKLVSRIRSLPCLPSIYTELMAEIRSDDASVPKIGNLIAKDPGLAAKLLKLANSSFFGRPQRISDPFKAVGMLGLDMVQTVVLTTSIFEDFSYLNSKHVSADYMWEHAIITATLCKTIALKEGLDKNNQEVAFCAGLMHDIGKLLIAAYLPESFDSITQYMDQHQATIAEAESQVIGTTHAAIGAYLLGLWGLPLQIIEAVAFHHSPDEYNGDEEISLAIVHVADAIANSARDVTRGGEIMNRLDSVFLDRTDVMARIDKWRSISIKQLEEMA